MPSVAVKLYSVFFKFLLKHRLQNRIQTPTEDPFGITSRPEESIAAANPSFTDGVATKDIHIDPLTSLSIRIFLPESALTIDPHDPCKKIASKSFESGSTFDSKSTNPSRRNSYGSPRTSLSTDDNWRSSYDHAETPANSGSRWDENGHPQVIRSDRAKIEGTYLNYNSESGSVKEQDLGKVKKNEPGVYRGYLPADNLHLCRKLPIMLQFHGGGFVAGSNDSAANDFFCRRIAKLCDAVVIAVGYRLAPENRYPAAFDDGLKVLNWLGKQANLAECSKSLGNARRGSDLRRSDVHRHIVDTFGASMVEPWLAAHGDPSRCVLLGVSCGANIADFVARKAVAAGKLLEPVKVVAQVLMYPFFIGSVPTHSEIKLANSYFYDKAMCILAWKLFLPEPDFSLDHPAANPLVSGREPALRFMPPTLTVVAEHDWMRDRAIAYSEELRKVNIDSPVLEYKDAVHEFATLDMLLRTPQAHACAEDIAIWVKKYISLRGHEFSY